MSHHYHHDDCCCAGYGMPGYGMGGYGMMGGYGGAGCGGYGGWGIRWIYALLILIVVVLQFGRREVPLVAKTTDCDDGVVAAAPVGGFFGADKFFGGEFIDRSVLFIIVVFLLIICAGCWGGGFGNYGAAGGFGTGYGGYGY